MVLNSLHPVQPAPPPAALADHRTGRAAGEAAEMKSYYRDDLSTIYCGDCAQVMADAIPDNSIDLTVTSPPYDGLRAYNGYTFDFEAIAGQLWRVTKPGGVVAWVVGDETKDGCESLTSFRQALYFNQLGFNVETMIYKNNGTGAKGSNNLYWQAFEYMFVFSKGQIKTVNRIKDKARADNRKKNTYSGKTKDRGNRNKYNRVDCDPVIIRDNVWEYSTGFNSVTNDTEAHNHPAIFPEALARDHIISWSNPGDIVLDPMCGSGTTLKMAALLGRPSIGIDCSGEYCDLSVQRLQVARAKLGQSHTVEVKGQTVNQPGLFGAN